MFDMLLTLLKNGTRLTKTRYFAGFAKNIFGRNLKKKKTTCISLFRFSEFDPLIFFLLKGYSECSAR